MKEYHKINTIFKRDTSKPKNPIIIGEWSEPEFQFLANNVWVFTEKVDGTNIRIMWNDGKLTFGGKTDNAQIPSHLLNRLNEIFTADKFIEAFGVDTSVCFYGEGYGRNIQKVGSLYRDNQDFVLFDVKIGDWWLQRENVENIATSFGLEIVPIVGEGTLYEAINLVKVGMKSQWGNFESEGIVARPKVELQNRGGKRIITKIKTSDFKNL
jgi:ATP-dependent RNA circularization protein (DNA/RNA ligase family)